MSTSSSSSSTSSSSSGNSESDEEEEAIVRQKEEQLSDVQWDLDIAESQVEQLTATLKRARDEAEEADQRARDAEQEAEQLEEEAEQTRLALEHCQRKVAALETKLSHKRVIKADLLDALDEASGRLKELEVRNRELTEYNLEMDDRERRREHTFKRGKLLREFCDPPRSPNVVGFTECYVEQFGAAMVLEPTKDCNKPRPSLRKCAPAAVSNEQLVNGLLSTNTRCPDMLLQFFSAPNLWRDCIVVGPSLCAAADQIAVVFRHPLHGERSGLVTDVEVTKLRFRDFADEEDFWDELKKPHVPDSPQNGGSSSSEGTKGSTST